MSFLTKISNFEYLIHVLVKPNSIKQKVEIIEDELFVFLKSKPVKNKANRELIEVFKKALKLSNDELIIISGIKSRNKVIKIQFKHTTDKIRIENTLKKLKRL